MNDAFLTRAASADYLSRRTGRKISVGALHRHASEGTGPKYVMILGRASYRTEDLDSWIEGLIKAPTKQNRDSSLGDAGSSQ